MDKKRIKKRVPLELTHYTTLDGFMGIVKDQEIWASEATFLNDRQEIAHGLEGAKEFLCKITSDPEIAEKIILSLDLGTTVKVEKLTESAKKLLDNIEDGEIPSVYVACFSEENDSLSQWRAYGKQQGIAITLETDGFQTKNRLEHARLISVAYCDKVEGDFFHKDLIKELQNYAYLHALGFPDENEVKNLEIFLYSLIAKFKHQGFEKEAEWRVVSMNEDRIHFRNVGNHLIPYVPLKNGDQPLPIAKVMIGPGHDQNLTMRSVKKFLQTYGSKSSQGNISDIPVEISKIPYRAF